MSTAEPPPAVAVNHAAPPAGGFPTATALQAAHAELARAAGGDGEALEHAAAVRGFVAKAVATGPALDAPDDRLAAQALVNYWVSRSAGEARRKGLPPPPVCDPDFDTLLPEFDPATLAAATKAVDARLNEANADPEVVRRILVRLLRMRPAGAEFDAAPASRASLRDLPGVDPGEADKVINALADSGVVRVAPGPTAGEELVELRPALVASEWGHLRAARASRAAFRNQAETRAPAPAWGRVAKWSEDAVAAFGGWVGHTRGWVFARVSRAPDPGPDELNADQQDEAEEYQDLSEAEVWFLRASRHRQRRLVNINRGHAWLMFAGFAAAVGLAVVALSQSWYAHQAARRAGEEEAKAKRAEDQALDRLRLSSLRVVARGFADVATARRDGERAVALRRWDSIVQQRPLQTALSDINLPVLRGQATQAQTCTCPDTPPPPEEERQALYAKVAAELVKTRDKLSARPGTREALWAVRETAFDMAGSSVAGAVATLGTPGKYYGDAEPYVTEFWRQYWGEMLLVEGGDVRTAMIECGNALNAYREAAAPARDRPVAKDGPAPKKSESKKDGPQAAYSPPPPPDAEDLILEQAKRMRLDELDRLVGKLREQKVQPGRLKRLQDASEALTEALSTERRKPLPGDDVPPPDRDGPAPE